MSDTQIVTFCKNNTIVTNTKINQQTDKINQNISVSFQLKIVEILKV